MTADERTGAYSPVRISYLIVKELGIAIVLSQQRRPDPLASRARHQTPAIW
jgi:hypothetical protein